MAVPSSGVLSLLAIHNELAENDYSSGTSRTNVSLEDLSDGTVATINTSNDSDDRPDGSAPHAMSEFYDYDHDVGGVPLPGNRTYTAISTTAMRFQFDDPVGVTRVYFFQGSAASFTIFDGSPMKIDGNTQFISVDGSGTTSLNISDDNSNDQIYNTSVGGYVNIDLGPNDFMDISYKSYNNGEFSDMSSDIRGYTLPDFVGNMNTTAISSHAMTINWDAPSGGVNSTNGYRYYHGTNSTATNNSAVDTSNTSVSLTGLSANTTYYWTVQTKGDGGDFQDAHPVAITALTAPDSVGTITSSVGTTSITLSWGSHPAGTTGYRVYHGIFSPANHGSNTVTTIDNSRTNVSLTGLVSGQTYNYGVQPQNSDGTYGDLEVGSATTTAAISFTFALPDKFGNYNQTIANGGTHTTAHTGVVGGTTVSFSDIIRVVVADGHTGSSIVFTTDDPSTTGSFSYKFYVDTSVSNVQNASTSDYKDLDEDFDMGNFNASSNNTFFFRVRWVHGALPLSFTVTSDTVEVTATNSGASGTNNAHIDTIITAAQ